jgi:hypothetical protein
MRYRGVGRSEVFDHKQGEEFEASLDPVTEARLVSGGHLERVDKGEYSEDEAHAAAEALGWVDPPTADEA